MIANNTPVFPHETVQNEGVTLLDWLAAKVLHGQLAAQRDFLYWTKPHQIKALAEYCYQVAAAMMEARAKWSDESQEGSE